MLRKERDEIVDDLRLLRRTEVEQLLGLGKTKTLELVKTGELEAIRIGRALRIFQSSVRTLQARLRQSAVPRS